MHSPFIVIKQHSPTNVSTESLVSMNGFGMMSWREHVFPSRKISELTGTVAGMSKKTTETGSTNSGELITSEIEFSKTSCF